jgi:hypothetical protein
MRLMTNPAIHEITIAPALDRRGERIAGCFDARIDHGERLVHATRTPLYDSALILPERGLAKATDRRCYTCDTQPLYVASGPSEVD